ncbi:MAG: terminase [Rickettsiales bacterium]|nr:terminase [Rickettsiales bacterium]
METPEQDIEHFQGNPLVKKVGAQIQFTKEQIEEYVKCSQDPFYFIEKYMKIVTIDSGVQVIKLYDFQREMINKFVNEKFILAKCARQSGKTIGVESFILWSILFKDNYRVGMFANKFDTSKKILKEIKYSYEQLPMWLQQGVVTWNKHSIELENGSSITSSSTSGDAGRSRTYNLVFLDEFAFVPDYVAADFFTAVYPTISSGKNTKVIIISTPNGLNFFYRMWVEAQEGRSNYKLFEANWRAVPSRDDAWADETLANVGEKAFQQEYECDFLGSSNTLISTTKIKEMVWKKPVKRYQGGLAIYEEPKPRNQYIVTVDVSRGIGKDYSAFTVINVSDFPYKIAAKYQNNEISPMVFPNTIYETATHFNQAMVLVEVNDIGEQVGAILYNDLEYEDLIMTEHGGRKGQRISSGFGSNVYYGVRMTGNVKKIGMANLKTMIESDKLLIHDVDIITELSTFVQKRNSYEAEEGYNDDLVMCLVIFGWVSNQEYFKELTNSDIRKKLEKEREQEIMEASLPPGFVVNGEEEESFTDSDGTVWFVVR